MSGNIGFTDNNLQFLIIKHNSNRIYWALEVLLKTHRPCLSSIFQIIVTNGHKDIGPIVNCACCMSGTIVYIPDTEVNKRDRSLYFLWSLHFRWWDHMGKGAKSDCRAALGYGWGWRRQKHISQKRRNLILAVLTS